MSREARIARARMRAAWRAYRDRQAIRCANCGLSRSNVVHETDREHAPEGLAYYADVPFCDFASTRPDIVTAAREATPSRDVEDYLP